jgi:hypothetical protein
MAVIKRGIGRSPTEEKLAALADKIFLNLWTYPNLFKSDGKELCDLLVVCRNDVLIFRRQNIAWQKRDDFGLSWSRWYHRAIEESAAQINGASRYLREHPDELFLDTTCKGKFPLTLPPLDRRRLHHIAVALGASEACVNADARTLDQAYEQKAGPTILPSLRRRRLRSALNVIVMLSVERHHPRCASQAHVLASHRNGS